MLGVAQEGPPHGTTLGPQLRALKDRGERFAMITCYDYPSARLVDQVGIPGVLVGDSLGTVVLGYDSHRARDHG